MSALTTPEHTTICTCGCPDGHEQHLENCEIYLRYWEIDLLNRIQRNYDLLTSLNCRPTYVHGAADELISDAIRFANSVTELSDASVNDPIGIIRGRCRRYVGGRRYA